MKKYMLSRACEYSIRIMIYIQTQDDKTTRVGLDNIIDAIGSPRAFTAKILQKLVKSGLLKSARGPNGGFSIDDSKEISLADIVVAVDGNEMLTSCILGLPECGGENPCPVHHKYLSVKETLNELFENTSLDETAERVLKGKSFLKK